MAKRVLPVPPAPVTVSTRTPVRICSVAWASAVSRPRSVLAGVGAGREIVGAAGAALAVGRLTLARVSARRHSSTEANRSAGDFASARSTASITGFDTVARSVPSFGTGSIA